jgi:hypothetical protein
VPIVASPSGRRQADKRSNLTVSNLVDHIDKVTSAADLTVFSIMTTPLTAFRLAARSLLGARGFTIAAVVTLTLGITLCTTAMVVVGAYLLEDLPYPAADRLHWIRYGAQGQEQPRHLETLA